MAKYSIVGGGDGGCCGAMSEKAPLIGLVCTLIGLVLSIVVYVDTGIAMSDSIDAAKAAGWEVKGNAWFFDEVIALVLGIVLGVVLLIAYIPVVLIELGCCGCLGTVKETVLKGAFEAKGKVIKVILTVLSLLVFALVLVYLIHCEVVMKEFGNLTTGILSVVAVVFFLLNLVISILYLRK